MQPLDGPVRKLDWLRARGVSNLDGLNPCVPGEFTLSNTYYVNTATPEIVYVGSGEGTLPLLEGRWYLIPGTILETTPDLIAEAQPVARSVRLSRASRATSGE